MFSPIKTGALSIKLIVFSLFFLTNISYANVVLIAKSSEWKYLDDGSNQGTAWKEVAFDDGPWQSGNAKLGFGDINNTTTINNHQDPIETGAATWYFRKSFTVNSPADFASIKYKILRDDGAVIYLNGTEIGRSNMPEGNVFFDTLADSTVSGGDEEHFFTSGLLANHLLQGDNIIAVEIHQRSLSSSDTGFDLEFIGSDENLVRGPYLQSQSPDSIVVKWRTLTAVNSRVSWGTAVNSLENQVDDAILTMDHEVILTGLSPTEKIYYSIGTSTEVYAGNSAAFYFIMPPLIGSQEKFRFWVIGDSGTANSNAAAVKNAYLNFTQTTHTNLWLMLGDNAYGSGTDSEYQAAVFDMYPELLQVSALWSTIGNHDRGNASSIMQSGVYYDTFSFPKFASSDGMSTGVDSGTEAYYSFDYANVHFIVLESHETNSTFRNGMVNWLNSDLLMAESDWIVALWHHPPYTKGSHDSDTESQLTYMRENILGILENKGVDLVLTGHSHSYERSWLIDGHYGHSDTFDELIHLVDGSEGTPNISPYKKDLLGISPNEGAVYVVAGSSGKTGGNQGEAHEAMRNTFALPELGSLVIDVNKGVMDVVFLNDYGEISDEFRIIKGDIIFIDGFE